MKPTTACAAALALTALLAGCGPKGGGATNGAAGGAPGAGAAASGPDVAVDLANVPHQRAGLWKTVLDDGDGKPDTSTVCMSGKAPPTPKMPPGCSQFNFKRTFLGAYVMDMNCTTPEYSVVMHAVVNGDFQSHLTGDSVMTMSGKNMPARTIKMHNEETWIGPCAPGQQPDDEPG